MIRSYPFTGPGFVDDDLLIEPTGRPLETAGAEVDTFTGDQLTSVHLTTTVRACSTSSSPRFAALSPGVGDAVGSDPAHARAVEDVDVSRAVLFGVRRVDAGARSERPDDHARPRTAVGRDQARGLANLLCSAPAGEILSGDDADARSRPAGSFDKGVTWALERARGGICVVEVIRPSAVETSAPTAPHQTGPPPQTEMRPIGELTCSYGWVR